MGRTSALARLREQFAVASHGTPRVVWIDGEPGMGKTTLVRAFLAEGQHRAAWASGDDAETTLPYGVLTMLHSSIASAVGASAPGAPGLSPASDVLAAGAELVATIGATDDPLVIVIDDLQWSDPQSASALRFALRRMLAERVLIILITRPHPEDSLGDAWGRLLSDSDRVSRIHLDGLTTDGMVDLVVATGHANVARQTAERLRDHTNGSPLHARALLDELGDAALRANAVLPAPRSFAQLTVGRLANLDDQAVALVTAGAVLGSSFPLALAAEVGDIAVPSAAFDRAAAAGLLERHPDGSVRFAHPLVRGAIYNDLSATRLQALHRAAADATSGARSLDHRIASTTGPDDELAAQLERVALGEFDAGAGSVASDHFQAAADLSSGQQDRERRVLLAVEALMSVGQVGRAQALRETVLACGESAHRSYVLGLLEPSVAAEEHYAAAAAGAADADMAGLRVRAICGLAAVRMRQGRYEDALHDANMATELGVEGWGVGWTRLARVVCLSQLGRTAEARALVDQIASSRAVGSVADLDEVCTRGLLQLAEDDLAGSVRSLTELTERARAGETCRMLMLGLCLRASAHYLLGQWDESAMDVDLALTLAREARRQRAGMAYAVAAFVHAGQGRFDLAEADVLTAAQVNRSTPTAGSAYYAAIARAVLAQARGDSVELHAATAPLLDGSVVPTVEGLDRWSWQVMAIEGLIGTGELDAARERLVDLVDMVEADGLWSPRTDVARLTGSLAEAADDHDAALAAYTAGAQPTADHPPLPLPAARLALGHGSLLRRTGARRAAIEQLRAARAGFVALGAVPFLEVCDAELAACGLTTPAADGSGAYALTSSEQAVLHLVSQGLTNREAAARLYVSPKTVDYHLGNIYAKLGISSRRELSRFAQT